MLVDGKEAADARAYLDERGIDRTTAETFGIGYAPGYPDFLLRGMSKDVAPELLLEAGLATKGAEGGVRDRFRGRIVFPIQDLRRQTRGLRRADPAHRSPCGRAREIPQHRRDPDLPERRAPYNLARARGAITRTGEAFVVEGYTDVIAMHQSGIESAVATCGTALGESHFRLLSRFAQRVVLSFDSDEAGARAAERAFTFHERFPLKAVVMILPDGLDPADFVRAHGSEALREAAVGARPLVEFMLTRSVAAHDRSTVEGQSAAVEAALPILEGLSEPVRQREYAHQLAELAGVAESSVLLALDQRMRGRPVEVSREVKRGSVQERVEREMLKLLARDQELFTAFAPRLSDEHFRTPQNRKLFGVLLDAKGDVRGLVAEQADDEKLVGQLTSLTVAPLDGDQDTAYAQGVWSRLEEFHLKRRSDELRGELQRLNPTTDARYDELFQKLVRLDGRLRRLRHRDDGAPVPVP